MCYNDCYCLESIPVEIHALIGKYLNGADILSMSLMSSAMRQVYHCMAYRSVVVTDSDTPTSKTTDETNFSTSNFLFDRIAISFKVFSSPEKYSWYPSASIQYIYLEHTDPRIKEWYPTSSFLLNYSNLLFLGFLNENIGMLYLNCPPTTCTKIVCSQVRPSGYIKFQNLVPFLKNLQTLSPAQMCYIISYYGRDVEEAVEKYNWIREISNTELEESIGKGYCDSKSMEYEQHFNNYLNLTKSNSVSNDSDMKPRFTSELAVFPKPNWTDLLVDLSVNLRLFKSYFPENKLTNRFRYFMLDNYPSLKRVEIEDEESNSTLLSQVVYESLERCKRLKKVAIFYCDLGKDQNDMPVLKLINKIKGSWEFYLRVVLQGQPQIPYEFSNLTVTGFEIVPLKRVSNNLRICLNDKVLEKLKVTIDYDLNDIMSSWVLDYKRNLSYLDIYIFVERLFEEESLKGIGELFALNDFPNLKFLKIKSLVFSKRLKLKTEIKKLYFKVFLKAIKFGDPPKTIDEAIQAFKKIQSLVHWDIPQSLTRSVFEKMRENPVCSQFIKCYDHPNGYRDKCCQAPIEAYLLTSLYCLFAYCFIPLRDVSWGKLPEDKIRAKYLASSLQFDSLFHGGLKRLPSLKEIVLFCSQEKEDIFTLPHLQKFIKYHPSIQRLKYDGNSNWSIIMSEDCKDDDEWLGNVFIRGIDQYTNDVYIGH